MSGPRHRFSYFEHSGEIMMALGNVEGMGAALLEELEPLIRFD